MSGFTPVVLAFPLGREADGIEKDTEAVVDAFEGQANFWRDENKPGAHRCCESRVSVLNSTGRPLNIEFLAEIETVEERGDQEILFRREAIPYSADVFGVSSTAFRVLHNLPCSLTAASSTGERWECRLSVDEEVSNHVFNLR